MASNITPLFGSSDEEKQALELRIKTELQNGVPRRGWRSHRTADDLIAVISDVKFYHIISARLAPQLAGRNNLPRSDTRLRQSLFAAESRFREMELFRFMKDSRLPLAYSLLSTFFAQLESLGYEELAHYGVDIDEPQQWFVHEDILQKMTSNFNR